jgi:hypothetical protein
MRFRAFERDDQRIRVRGRAALSRPKRGFESRWSHTRFRLTVPLRGKVRVIWDVSLSGSWIGRLLVITDCGMRVR